MIKYVNKFSANLVFFFSGNQNFSNFCWLEDRVVSKSIYTGRWSLNPPKYFGPTYVLKSFTPPNDSSDSKRKSAWNIVELFLL